MSLTAGHLATALIVVGSLLSISRPGFAEEAVQLDTTIRVQMQYLLHLPKGYKSQESWPLVLFLHGAGERGSDLELVKVHGPPKLASQGKDFPFILISPQCPKDTRWEPLRLLALVDDACERYRVDPERIYVTGLSMGGFGAWELAAYAPERIAAIVPICGGGKTYWAKSLRSVPVWAFHGVRDKAVPLQYSVDMVEAVRKEKGEAKLTIYPEAEHDSWTESYDNPELFDWLLSHRNQPIPVDEKPVDQ